MNANEARNIIKRKGYSIKFACKAMEIKQRSMRDNLSKDPLRKKFALQVKGLPDLIPGESFEDEEQYIYEICDIRGIGDGKK